MLQKAVTTAGQRSRKKKRILHSIIRPSRFIIDNKVYLRKSSFYWLISSYADLVFFIYDRRLGLICGEKRPDYKVSF